MKLPMIDQSELAKAEDEAADWAVLLADDPDNLEQREAFNSWLALNPANADVWARTRRVQEALGELPPVTRKGWPTAIPGPAHRNKEGSPRHRFSMVGRLNRASLASLALAACLMLLFIPPLTLHLSADYVSGTGEQQILALADGSRLFLSPESAVDIAFSGSERTVRLLRGSAFFEVQPDAGRPFHVDAGESRTTVLGTAFSVNRRDSGAVVSVAHGHVKVEDRSLLPPVSETLKAGDRLAVTRGRDTSLTHTEPGEVALWRKGELIARDQPIREIVESFRRYYRGAILVSEPLASQRVTGLYRLDAPVTTLSDMAEAHGARARLITPWLLVLGE